ncbi:hypothetical protein [Shimia marina]|uniref:Uncharacterized protein n=1 Tax=Shimia marina TaxID=321267 RepID=A0A0P1EK96_9RHOB|nr:hypothetical protein [Shimia marina]CUH50609.1 hypothetical protein SHM7688_00036 [Shimia marina]SFE39006.1 hypothetical protein SAMN04488037_108158 [Shimia marina]
MNALIALIFVAMPFIAAGISVYMGLRHLKSHRWIGVTLIVLPQVTFVWPFAIIFLFNMLPPEMRGSLANWLLTTLFWGGLAASLITAGGVLSYLAIVSEKKLLCAFGAVLSLGWLIWFFVAFVLNHSHGL